MRLLAFSDLHRDLDQADELVRLSADADLVVGAGDFASVHEGLEETIGALDAITAPTVLVPGNNETAEALRAATAGWNAATVLHGEATTIDGVPFFGLGAGIPTTPWDWSFDLTEEEAEERLEDCPEGAVLIVHSPPKGHCDRTSGGDHLGSHAILDAIARRQPDVFVFVGDTIYADHRCWGDTIPGADFVARTPEEFRAKHRYNRADPAMQRLLRATSVVAIWDDHDVSGNFAGPAEPLMPIGLAAFLAYWPLVPPADDPTRLYRALRWGRHLELFIVDTRQYRTPNRARDGADKTMLGAAQRRWLVDAVARSNATWKVIVSSVPLSIPRGWPFGDSWARRSVFGWETGFASERDALFRALAARGVNRVVALVADVHYGAFMTHRPLPGFEVQELIAGPLAASTKRPGSPSAEMNSTVHVARGGSATFGALEVTDAGIAVSLLDSRGATLGEVSLPAPRETAR